MMKKTSKNNNGGKMGGLEWEMRPGGMLVQKRNLDSNRNYPITIPKIKVLVKFGSSYHEIHIDSHASFGELKKLLAEVTGLHPQDQKLIYKDKERESKSFLDVCGIKDGSRIVLVQDIITMEMPMKSVAEVTMEVDKLVSQVTAVESVVCKGGRVTEKELLTLIELLMAQLIKLDGIVGDGDVKMRRKTQVVRIQKYIENLDRLKAQNSMAAKYGGGQLGLIVSQQQQQQQRPLQRNFTHGKFMLTSKWEKY